MLMPRFVSMFSAALMTMGAMAASGQTYPNKSIRIVASEPGGGSDFVVRLIAQGLTSSFGQQVIVENRGGGSGAVAAEIVAKASPDGYTLLFYSSAMWIVPLMRKVSYDPIRDFSPITLADRSPNILVVHPSLLANSVRDLIALAKARPGGLNYGASGPGTSPHLAAELFKVMAGVDIAYVPYKGAAAASFDLIGGRLQLMFATPAGVAPHVKSGKLRALAVTSAQPSELLPGLPTVSASGLPGYESGATHAIFSPAGTPVTIINRLNREIVQVIARADLKEQFLNRGMEAVSSSPEQLAAAIKSEMVRLGKVIKDAGIKAD